MKLFKKFFKWIISILIVILVLFIFTKYINPDFSVFSKLGFKTSETRSGETLKSSLNKMGFLVTTEYNYTHAETYEKSRSLFVIKEFPGTKSKFIYVCDGVISAGIDFEKIDLIVNETDNKITINVKMPSAEIKYSELDLNSFKILDEEKSIFNPINVEDVKNSFSAIKTDEENKAKEKGLLEKATANAETVIENFLKSSVGNKPCDIVFEN